MAIELDKITQITDKYQSDPSMLIQILLEIQRENHWLSKESLTLVSERLGVPLNRIYQITTFYKAFSLIPKGQHIVTVCTGTACHVRGSPRIVDRVQEILGIPPEKYLLTVLPVGYPAEEGWAQREELNTLLHFERFGNRKET